LAAETRELAAPMLSLAVGGAATWWCAVRRKWRYAPLPMAIEFNLLACALVGLTLLDKAADSRELAAMALVAGFAIYAGAIVTRRAVPQLWGHAALYALASSIATGLFAASLGVVSGLGRHPLDLSLANVLTTLGIATAAGLAIASGAQPWKIARLVLAA